MKLAASTASLGRLWWQQTDREIEIHVFRNFWQTNCPIQESARIKDTGGATDHSEGYISRLHGLEMGWMGWITVHIHT